MENITSILKAYEQQETRRALGGIYALAGFDYQLRCYLAEFAEALTGQGSNLNEAGGIFLEALSDVARHGEKDQLVCIQVKRTLTSETLKDAAAEVLAIDRFLSKHYPNSRTQVKFEIIALQGNAAIQWNGIPTTHPARATIDELLRQDRLLPPRIEPDPWWRAIVAVWRHVNDPYAFLRFALDRALNRAPIATDAQRIRDDICERFTQSRRTSELPGQLLTSADFQPSEHPSPTLEVGREITLARLRDQQYMPRANRLDALYTKLLEQKDLSLHDLKSEARVFWLSGRSGVGKSVLLLQTLKRLVTDGWRVLWLKGQAELLEPALRTIADAPAEWRPDFIAIDDLYDRDARTRLDLGRLSEFIDERGQQAWPMILTCGPTDFADSFRENATHRGFDLHLDTVETITTHEAVEIKAWYSKRTGKSIPRGTAFSQAMQEDNGLFVSLAVELAHGDLKAFSARFSERIHLNNLDEALRLPLALNRLYLRTPYHWLTELDREKLATLNSDGDFSLLDAGEEGQIVRLTHPHLANTLYLALRKPANAMAYTNDLSAVFQRALKEHDQGLVFQLLRLFSGREKGLVLERLSIVDRPRLAQQCAQLWATEHTNLNLDADGLADVSTSWACWAVAVPSIRQTLGADLLTAAFKNLGAAYKVWTVCWEHLSHHYPNHHALFDWAAEHLTDQMKINHPTWSLVWEQCLQDDAERHHSWREIGLTWLQSSFRRPDWHFVWKKLLPERREPDWKNDTALLLGLRRLHANSDGSDWAFVLQDLYVFAIPHSPQARELTNLARLWLSGREDRAEWAHIWRALLEQHDALPETLSLSELLQLGATWLNGHEDRAEWAYIWRALLEQHNALPETLPFRELLQLGVTWLDGHEDRAEWAHIWRALLEQRDALPESLPFSELLQLGATWLDGHEDRAEWNYVWRALLEQHDALPETLSLSELLQLGATWLDGHEDRAEWNYVWQALLEQRDALPETLPFSELLQLGATWLDCHEDRAEWAHIWRALLEQRDALPEVLPLSELLQLGAAWLDGHEDRAEWAHIWQSLLEQRYELPQTLPFSGLLQLGATWLDGHEDRAEWAHIWQDLLEQRYALPDILPFSELLQRGATWLDGHEDRAEWAHIWRALLEQRDALPETLPFSELLHLGAMWLDGHKDETEEWSFVCEVLLERQFQSQNFLACAANWLNRSREKPEWPLLAAKFIVVAPQHPASVEFAVILAERIKACPNNAHWFKTVYLVADLMPLNTLPMKVNHWLQVLNMRRELPAWAEARRCLNDGLSVKGQITAPKGKNSFLVQLDIGLLAICDKTQIGLSVAKEKISDFFVLQLNPEKGLVLVGPDRPVKLEMGKSYEGVVKKQAIYGLFITINEIQGLLHKNQCPDWPNLMRKYQVGSHICVEVLELSEKGPVLRYAGPELTSDCEIEEITIGSTYDAYITGLQEYGIFLRIGSRSGLLHRSLLSPDVDILHHYTVGQCIAVQVVSIREGGKISFTLPTRQSSSH
ncbi:S1 RNA-binding domain-containing protein [Pectobacterium polaris]|uniref:S1 RNA-binding domain-containing protein n=2 Tax=Pectobacterium polaris TaxID=2042057 RepID=UPI0021C9B475|nr:S1 RNA-binding domain-containing protein [Pectobacterium polaris]MCU1796939.1 S1 RNA-binding domain-containing protein [Pectobacterium polaris]